MESSKLLEKLSNKFKTGWVATLFRKKNEVATRFVNTDVQIDDFDNFILKWNERLPVDRWWREKHKVAFLSEEHKKMNPIDIYLEYREDKMYMELRENNSKVSEVEEKKTDEEQYKDFLDECEKTDYSSYDDE
jgi:hypothetical protein